MPDGVGLFWKGWGDYWDRAKVSMRFLFSSETSIRFSIDGQRGNQVVFGEDISVVMACIFNSGGDMIVHEQFWGVLFLEV